MRSFFMVLLLVASCCTFAQNRYAFHSLNYLGMMGGKANSAFQMHSVNGFQRKTWFGGIGLGLDYYYYTTVPLYASFRKYFGTKQDAFYVSADGGTNFVWDKTTANIYNGNSNNGRFKPSLYYGAHAGYKFAIVKNRGTMLFDFGYTGKHIRESLGTPLPCLVPPCPFYDQQLKYNLRRVSFRVGWQF